MAEVAGLTASIIAILQLSATVITYIRDAKGATKERDGLAAEITSIKVILAGLETKSEADEWKDTMKCLSTPNGPLDQFKSVLKGLECKLKPIIGKGAKFARSMMWPFAKTQIKEIFAAMERLKLLFVLALQNKHMYSCDEVLY
jgi:hypothetical protein